MMKHSVGVIHGRFQMLHLGHIEYLLAGKQRCDYLIIGITNPDIFLTKDSTSNPHRSKPESNPLTYFERFQLIRGAMIENHIALDEFDIVPFPINYPERLFNYVPRQAKYFMTIYDEWSREKKSYLENLGCSIEIMWERDNDQKITSGTEVRNLIVSGLAWEHLVPKFVHQYIVDNQIDIRLKRIATRKDM